MKRIARLNLVRQVNSPKNKGIFAVCLTSKPIGCIIEGRKIEIVRFCHSVEGLYIRVFYAVANQCGEPSLNPQHCSNWNLVVQKRSQP